MRLLPTAPVPRGPPHAWTVHGPAAHCEEVDVDAVALELYGLTPETFTAARNQMAQAAKDGGAPAASAAIKALRKPTLAAWLANLLVRTDPDGVNNLTELRAAHLSANGARSRELTPRRHDLVQSLVKTARAHANAQRRSISDTVADHLTETLDAAVRRNRCAAVS